MRTYLRTVMPSMSQASREGVQVEYSEIATQKASKEGGKMAAIKLDLQSGGSLMFDFRTANGLPDFETRNRLKNFLNRAKDQRLSDPTPDPALNRTQEVLDRASSRPRVEERSIRVNEISQRELLQRAEILMKNAEIRKLHEFLVGKRLISDDEFFKAVKFRLKRESQDENALDDAIQLERGLPTSMSDPLKAAEESVERKKFILTPAAIHQIFLAHPAVHRAYRDLVPSKMNQAVFFQKFLESSLYNRDRLGAAASQADELFSKYEVEDADAYRREIGERVGMIEVSINLTKQDPHEQIHLKGRHAEDSDVAIQSRKNAPFLPLARYINRHGTLVIDAGGKSSGGGESHAVHTPWREETHREVLEDLLPAPQLPTIPLEIQQSSAFFRDEDSNMHDHADLHEQSRQFIRHLQSWDSQKRQRHIPDVGSRLEQIQNMLQVHSSRAT